MKQHWLRFAQKIDALTLRERAIVFAMVALILVTLVNTALLNPQYEKQKQLSQRIKQDQSVTAGMQAEIQTKVLAQPAGSDQAKTARLQQLQQQSQQMQLALRELQKGLVSPDKMPALLEDILKQNGSLRLVSLKTLPVSVVTSSASDGKSLAETGQAERAAAAGKDQPESKPVVGVIYRHGVEIVVQGGYFDILRYLEQMEAVPWQIFWGQAKLNVDKYPNATLALTLFTLSLDKKWLNL